MDKKLFSLVIPAYREEKTIVKNLQVIKTILDKIPYEYEVIVVVDGSIDNTYKEVLNIKDRRIKALTYKKNQGKGFAVRYGMLRARGEIVGFLDAGLDISPESILIALDLMKLHKADIVVGSKLHQDSEVDYPIYRKFISFCYRWINQFLFGLTVLDTQVGLKIFKGNIARDVFPRVLVKKFAFDIELLALANALGYQKIFEFPVKLNFKKNSISKKELLVIMFRTFWDTLAVFYRIRVLQYYRKRNRKNWLKIDESINS